MNERCIAIRTRDMVSRVAISDILYLERQGRQLLIETTQDQYAFYEDIKNIRPLLDTRFYEVLQAYYINFDRVRSMKNFTVNFDCGKKIFFARDPFRKARNQFFLYLKKKEEKALQGVDYQGDSPCGIM